jgi:integrase/recombinase XerC
VVQLKEEGLSARSLNRKISAVNGYYKFLMRKGLSTKNPASLLHAQRLPERLPSFLKKAEADQLLDDITFEEGFSGATHRLILELLYATGMRRSELANLKESDIEWSLQQIRVMGKGGKERLLPVSNALLDSVRDYLAAKKEMGIQQPAVLSLPDGKKPYEKYIYNVARKYLGMVTTLKKRSPHILRHTFATHLLNNGANIQAIKELLGHSSIAATQVYTHINIEELKKVHKFNHPKG